MKLFSATSFILLMYSPAVLADGACTPSGGIDSDCGLFGYCALSEADASAGLVCCINDDAEYVSGVGIVCTGLANGKKCGGENRVCASGVCGMDNVCKQESIGDESPCRNDDQCASGACGRSEADASAGLVCCTSGDSSRVSTLPYPNIYVCTGLAVGMKCGGENGVCASGLCGMDNLCKACFDDSICESNVCVSGVCQGSKKWGNEPCEKDTHCHSGQCKNQDSDGLGWCQPFASLAAKIDYINDSADCPLVILPPDANNSGSGSVSLFIRAVGFSEEGTEHFMFGQEVLGGVDKCLGSFVAQRQGSQVCFSYQRGDKIGGGDEKFTCVTECANVCKEKYCTSDRFYKYKAGADVFDKDCWVTVKFEDEDEEAEAQADSNNNNGGYETLGDMSSLEDILNMNGFDPDSSTRVIASVGISLFTAASIAFLFW